MKYSSCWLQDHLDKPLPAAEELVHAITMKAFEVEEVVNAGNDTVFAMKILPDRSHDALSHRGMAREIAALFDLPTKARAYPLPEADTTVVPVRVAITHSDRCFRYAGMRVEGITVEASPAWLKTKLETVGARSINNIVDITNFILFDLGQPMHAFDAAKVVGGITVRLAHQGERMTTLDGKELTFDGTETVIADDEGPLALAGIKGGKKAEVDERTTAIIFESANFDPVSTRRTSVRHNIKTDASKRFENGISSTLALEAMEHAAALVKQLLPDAKIGTTIDVFPTPEQPPSPVAVTLRELNGLLGTAMNDKDVRDVLRRLERAGFTYEKDSDVYLVTPPSCRLDVVMTEDLIEEIGRHYGYEKIVPALPVLGRKGVPNKRLYYTNTIRKFLVERGYSEVFTYSFAPRGEGEVEVLNPVGKDRPCMRQSLVPGIARALASNLHYAPLLEINDVKLFEFGNVFSKQGERMMLAIGAMGGTKKRWKTLREELSHIAEALRGILGVGGEVIRGTPSLFTEDVQSGIVTLDFDALIAHLPMPSAYEPLVKEQKNFSYTPFSPYPFIVRDVALWVPLETKSEDVEKVIRAHAGMLAQKIYQFDTFEKEGRKSFAFRIILQSFERTLEDSEANAVYDRVVAALRAADKNWEVRA